MNAVWSFWSKPYELHRAQTWLSEKHHLLSWVLSLATAAQHYRHTVLFTDDAGARMLIDGIGLEFDEVNTSLNALNNDDPEWWALGKLHTYREQREAFVHIDSDVYLWRALPPRLEQAPLLAQNPEHFIAGASYYEPEVFEALLSASKDSWLPREWTWYRASGANQRGENCGIFGGQRVDFIQYSAAQAIELIRHRVNRRIFNELARKDHHTVVVEQYVLAACIEYHRQSCHTDYENIHIEYLFDSMREAFESDKALQFGYTHLIANAKQDWQICGWLDERIRNELPNKYEQCERYLHAKRLGSI